MSSQNPPTPNLHELTPRVLSRSRRSLVCPKCASPKISGKRLCAACVARLEPELAADLALSIELGGDRAMIRALYALGGGTFHTSLLTRWSDKTTENRDERAMRVDPAEPSVPYRESVSRARRRGKR